jgi:hypothetical protein
MPTFDLTSPDGKTYSVEGPDGATPAQAFQILQQHLGSAASPTPSYGEDIAKSLPADAAGLVSGTLGLPGDVSNLLAHGSAAASDYLAQKMGFDKGPAPAASVLPTSNSIQQNIEGATGPLYQPQTGPGRVVQNAINFAPAVIGGPETLIAKILSRVAVPAVASEAAGELTKGTVAEPYARVGGALLGGAGASKTANMLADSKAINAATPSLAAIKSEASNAYDALTSRNVALPVPQAVLDTLAGDITTTLNNRGIRPSTADKIHAAISEIRSPATAGQADVADLVAARQNVKSLLGSPDANKAGAAVALPKIEAAIENSSPGTMAQIRDADKNWGAVRANEALDKKLARADLRASGADSGMNIGNKIRQKVADLLLSNEARFLPTETKADLEKIVRGTMTQNVLRHAGNLLGGGGGLGMLASGTAGYEAGGVPGAVAAALAGRGFKMANNKMVANQAARTAQNIRMRSPLGQQTPLILPPRTSTAISALLPALLSRPKQ